MTPADPVSAAAEAPSALEREIHEQPEAARRTLEALDPGTPLRAELFKWKPPARPGARILFVGSGSSRHAAQIAADDFRKSGVTSYVASAGEILGTVREHNREGVSGKITLETSWKPWDALVAVTQSGATGSVLRLLDRAGEEGVFRIVVTNEAPSPAVQRADLVYHTRAGPERAIPATKSFTTALLALSAFHHEWFWASLGASLVKPKKPAPTDGAGRLDVNVTSDGVGHMEVHLPAAEVGPLDVPRLLAEALDHAPAIRRFVAELDGALAAGRPWFFLGGGPLLPLASEGALKMMETAVLPALALRTEELVHGPFALVGRETPVVLLSEAVSESGEPSPAEARTLRALEEAGAPVLRLAGTKAGPTESSEDGRMLTIPLVGPPGLRAFQMAPPLQLLALYAGLQLGRNVDAPAGLRKAVRDD